MQFFFLIEAILRNWQAVNFESQTEGTFNSVEYGEEKCQHDYELHDEIGLRCRLCSFVCTEIKHVSPPFVSIKGRNCSSLADFDKIGFLYITISYLLHTVTGRWLEFIQGEIC